LLAASDLSVDNRRLGAALLVAAESAGVEIRRERAVAIHSAGDAVTGVRVESGETLGTADVILAAGPWSASIDGLPPAATPPVRPVKGEILRLRATAAAALPQHSVRGFVNGHEIYLVPRADGELVVGATVEELGFDTTVRAGAVRELLRDARAVVPGVDELELVEAIAGLRPGSPDNLPMIGRLPLDGLVVATGHHRNGVLLTPVTADLVTALVTGSEEDPELLRLVDPARFAGALT
jgi:glycine oxidase